MSKKPFSQGSKKVLPPPKWLSSDLFQGEKEVVIEHAGEEYRLRITRHGRLILTK